MEHIYSECHQRVEYESTLISGCVSDVVSQTSADKCIPYFARSEMRPFQTGLEKGVDHQQHDNGSVLFDDVHLVPVFVQLIAAENQNG